MPSRPVLPHASLAPILARLLQLPFALSTAAPVTELVMAASDMVSVMASWAGAESSPSPMLRRPALKIRLNIII